MTTRTHHHEAGSTVIESVAVVAVLILMLLLIVLGGRIHQTRNDLHGAAADAARAASIRQHPTTAARDARDTARRSLNRRGRTCRNLTVSTNTSALRPGGSVTVRVACTVALGDLAPLGIPARKTLSASATEVIDTYISTP